MSLALLCVFGAFAQEKNQQLTFCVDPDWMPFEGVINGQHTGIASDYLEIFKQLTPYSFTIKPSPSWHQTIEQLQSNACDLTLMLNRTTEREKFLSFSMPYFFGPNVLVSKPNIPFMQGLPAIGDMTLGVVSGYRLLEEIPRNYPKMKLKIMDSEAQGLKAVEQGEIDVYAGSLYSINLTINQLELETLKINGWISLQDQLRIGFTKANAHLIPAFNQAIDQITSKQHNTILNKWTNVKIVKQTDNTLLYYLTASAAIIFFIFLWRSLVNMKVFAALHDKNQELEKIKEELTKANKNLEYRSFHDNLTNLYNRHYFMSTVKDHFNNVLRHQCISAIMMIDLDFFKKINDEHGHNVGDKVLQQFSTVLSQVLRAGDIAARWGGEEFIVLLPKTTKVDSIALAQRLVKAVDETTFELNIHLTISVGVSQSTANDDIASWIERADIALYQAKNEGRNCIKAFAV
ncbi:diguanylate cyclase [Colwellia asteriadis]|uniref:diguanylate cyclase n=1 Tax=Colwellia asteriadis TaxID=517723 RepID=A0ABN1L2U1_9GAMM